MSRYDRPRVPAEVRSRVEEIRRSVRELTTTLDSLKVDAGTARGIQIELARLARELESAT